MAQDDRVSWELVTTITGFQRRALLQFGWLSNTFFSFHVFVQCILQVAITAILLPCFTICCLPHKQDKLMLLQQLSNFSTPTHVDPPPVLVLQLSKKWLKLKMVQVLWVFLKLCHTMNICLYAQCHPYSCLNNSSAIPWQVLPLPKATPLVLCIN